MSVKRHFSVSLLLPGLCFHLLSFWQLLHPNLELYPPTQSMSLRQAVEEVQLVWQLVASVTL